MTEIAKEMLIETMVIDCLTLRTTTMEGMPVLGELEMKNFRCILGLY